MGAAKGSWLDAHPQVRATLNAVWEMEPQTELLKLEQPRDGRGFAASTAIRVAKGHVSISYAVLINELLELPELSDFDARVDSKDYKYHTILLHLFRSGVGCPRGSPESRRGSPDGSAALPAGQPRMAARLPRALTAPLCRRRTTLATPVPSVRLYQLLHEVT